MPGRVRRVRLSAGNLPGWVNSLVASCIQTVVMRRNSSLMTLLHSTVAGLEQDRAGGGSDPAVAELKRSVVRAIADLELRKAETDKMSGAAEVASALASAGRAAYVVDPAALNSQKVAGLQLAFAQDAEPADSL